MDVNSMVRSKIITVAWTDKRHLVSRMCTPDRAKQQVLRAPPITSWIMGVDSLELPGNMRQQHEVKKCFNTLSPFHEKKSPKCS